MASYAIRVWVRIWRCLGGAAEAPLSQPQGEIVSLKGLGSAPGPSPKHAKLMASRLPHDAPQLGDALPYYGSVAKDMSLWPHTQFVRGFESGAASAVLPRHLCFKSTGDLASKGLGLGAGLQPYMCKNGWLSACPRMHLNWKMPYPTMAQWLRT